MRHIDFIRTLNPSNIDPNLIRCQYSISNIVKTIKGLTHDQSLRSDSYNIGEFINIQEDIVISGTWKKLVPNRRYPFLVAGYHEINRPATIEVQGDIVLTEGAQYILLYEDGEYLLVESDYAFSAV